MLRPAKKGGPQRKRRKVHSRHVFLKSTALIEFNSSMKPSFLYTVFCALFSFGTCLALIRERQSHILFRKEYWQFLAQRWKVVTFVISGTGVTLLGPFTADPTWDWVDGAFMSALAYLTGPWAVGVIYRGLRGLGPRSHIFPAVGIWLFSASWSYDIYLYWRDGFYPPTWSSNLILSSFLYLSAGLFWNLDWLPGKGGFFAFSEPEWPKSHCHKVFWKVVWMAIPLMVIAVWLTLGFLKVLHFN
jgi:hypothetical protein